MDREAPDHAPYTLGLKPLFCLPYILWEIVKANLDVAKIIDVIKNYPLALQMIRVKASREDHCEPVIYANSITLTPGTITLMFRTASSSCTRPERHGSGRTIW